MLQTRRVFRFTSAEAATCEMCYHNGPQYPIPQQYLFNEEQDDTTQVYLISGIEDVQKIFTIMTKRQALRWFLFLIGVAVTGVAVLYFGWVCAIPQVLLSIRFGSYLLCLPDGIVYDASRNVLYENGYLVMNDLPETYVYVKGAPRYEGPH